MSLLPSRGPDTSTSQEGELQVVGVDDEVAPLLDALNSETARAILNEIYEEPGTPSEIADRLDMSIQKVSYHIDKLDEQDLIDVAGTQYSEKGQEMTVYQPPDDPTVLFVGTQERKRSLTTMVKRLLPVVTIVALGSLLIEQLFGDGVLSVGLGSGGADSAETDGDGGDSVAVQNETETATDVATDTVTPTPTEASSDGDMGIAEATETPTPTEAPQGTATGTEEQLAQETEAARETATDIATETSTPAPETTEVVYDTAARATETAAGGGIDVSPGLAFFLGGMTVVALAAGWWFYTQYA